MQHSNVALPVDAYLARIGEIAYTVSSLEWTILGDLHRLSADLPDSLTLEKLEPETTSGIATEVRKATAEMQDGPTKEYLVAVYRALHSASTVRNDVLHARPATRPDGSQQLFRAETVNKKTTGVRIWIDDAWFDEAIEKLNGLLDSVNAVRPLSS